MSVLNKKTKFIFLIIFLFLVIFSLIFLIFTLISKKSPFKKQPSSTNSEETSPPTNNLQTEDQFDKQAFCEKEGPETLEYIEKLEAITEKSGNAMGGRGKALENWPDWTQTEIESFVKKGQIIKQAYQEVFALTPPPKLVSVHNKIETALSFWAEAVTSGNEGFISHDYDLINDSVSLTSQGNDYLKLFSEELKQIKFN